MNERSKIRQHRAAREAGADPAGKEEVYSRLGLTLTYPPKRKAGRSRSPTRVDHVRRSVSESECTEKPMCLVR